MVTETPVLRSVEKPTRKNKTNIISSKTIWLLPLDSCKKKKICKLDSEKWAELHKQKEEGCAIEEHSKQSEINIQQPLKLLNVSAQAKPYRTEKRDSTGRDASERGSIKGHSRK